MQNIIENTQPIAEKKREMIYRTEYTFFTKKGIVYVSWRFRS